ncbi:hypothetical protein HDU89_005797 [Geranomyces variabilis]|nr:hypothetical protein HDU89_005797 [Geranomyces variabilis]
MENILSPRRTREPFGVSESEDTEIGTEPPKLAAKSTESIIRRRRLVKKAAALTEEEELGPPRKKLQFSASTLLRGLGDDFPALSSAIATSPHRVSQMRRREDASTKKADGMSSQEHCYPSPGAAPPATEQRVLRPRIPRRTPIAVHEQVSDSESSDDGLDMLSTTPTRLLGEIASQHQKIWDRAVAAAREKKEKHTRLSLTSSESQRWREETQVDEDDVPRLPPPATQSVIADRFSKEVQILPSPKFGLDSIVDDIGEGAGSSDSAVGASGRGIASAEKKRKREARLRNATVASRATPGKALVWAATGALKP